MKETIKIMATMGSPNGKGNGSRIEATEAHKKFAGIIQAGAIQ